MNIHQTDLAVLASFLHQRGKGILPDEQAVRAVLVKHGWELRTEEVGGNSTWRNQELDVTEGIFNAADILFPALYLKRLEEGDADRPGADPEDDDYEVKLREPGPSPRDYCVHGILGGMTGVCIQCGHPRKPG